MPTAFDYLFKRDGFLSVLNFYSILKDFLLIYSRSPIQYLSLLFVSPSSSFLMVWFVVFDPSIWVIHETQPFLLKQRPPMAAACSEVEWEFVEIDIAWNCADL